MYQLLRDLDWELMKVVLFEWAKARDVMWFSDENLNRSNKLVDDMQELMSIITGIQMK
jgi:hypothetical protein